MMKERNVRHALKKMLLDETINGDFWRGYAEALADTLEIEINKI